MRRGWVWPAAWGALLALSSTGLWAYTALSSSGAQSCRVSVCIAKPWLAPALLTASAAGAAMLGAAAAMVRGGPPGRTGTAGGPAVALTAVGAVVAAAGAAVGIWMTWIGIGLAAVGAAGVLAARRERR